MRTTLRRMETPIEPAQPSLLEKKMNMAGREAKGGPGADGSQCMFDCVFPYASLIWGAGMRVGWKSRTSAACNMKTRLASKPCIRKSYCSSE